VPRSASSRARSAGVRITPSGPDRITLGLPLGLGCFSAAFIPSASRAIVASSAGSSVDWRSRSKMRPMIFRALLWPGPL
jgi:hypothetical protein